ncbi:hypothetical protein GCM10027089_52430 [Nocardia thraciensis]
MNALVVAGDAVLAHDVERVADPAVQVVREDRREELRQRLRERLDGLLQLFLLRLRQRALPRIGLLLDLPRRALELRRHSGDRGFGVRLQWRGHDSGKDGERQQFS